MATLIFGNRSNDSGGPRWLERFRAADEWVVAVWEATAAMAPGTGELARRLRQGSVDCGTCLVAASEDDSAEAGRAYVARARARLMEARYLLYLTRRFSAIDTKRYRGLSAKLDRALREVSVRGSP